MNDIEIYYNKFNEDKRLKSRHGRVEYAVTMEYVHRCIKEAMEKFSFSDTADVKILDLGAGCGAYSIPLSEEGYDVTAVELVKHNLGILKMNGPKVTAYQGNAMKLKRFENDTFDVTLLFGPMYHLHLFDEKLKALSEAKRVTKPGGKILVAYVMNDYAVITHAFKDKNILKAMAEGQLDEAFHCDENANDLYSFVRIDDINRLNEAADIRRDKIIAADGAADYMRTELNALSEEEFSYYIKYQLAVCERYELLGASSHTVDILTK